ncbi:MAG: hypothetical protein QXE74_08955 [Candidatus Bathyarchaeia archaeon]
MKHVHPQIAFASILLLCTVFLIAFFQITYVSGSEEVLLKIKNLENTFGQAFSVVLEAEAAGANVSHLIVKLNDAGKLLAEAEMAYRIGNFAEASSKAEECSALIDGILNEALNLKSSAFADAKLRLSNTLLFSLISEIVFITTLISIWILFKHFYFRKLLEMKPEITSNVEA